jgi:hypothetical protein
MLFFDMFVHVYELLLMRGWIFLAWCYFNDEKKKKSEIMVKRFEFNKPPIILWVYCGHTYVPSVHN